MYLFSDPLDLSVPENGLIPLWRVFVFKASWMSEASAVRSPFTYISISSSLSSPFFDVSRRAALMFCRKRSCSWCSSCRYATFHLISCILTYAPVFSLFFICFYRRSGQASCIHPSIWKVQFECCKHGTFDIPIVFKFLLTLIRQIHCLPASYYVVTPPSLPPHRSCPIHVSSQVTENLVPEYIEFWELLRAAEYASIWVPRGTLLIPSNVLLVSNYLTVVSMRVFAINSADSLSSGNEASYCATEDLPMLDLGITKMVCLLFHSSRWVSTYLDLLFRMFPSSIWHVPPRILPGINLCGIEEDLASRWAAGWNMVCSYLIRCTIAYPHFLRALSKVATISHPCMYL